MKQICKEDVELFLASLTQRKYCYIVNKGSNALYLSYQVMKNLINENQVNKKNSVVLPSTMCHSPANVALYANLDIIFCDVSEDDYTIDPNCLQAILESNSEILGVLAVSIFGHSPDMGRISELCKKFNVWLIDDACQGIGGYCDNSPLGNWGEIGIYSFGHSKIIDIGWGGAILTDSERIYEKCKTLYQELEPISKNIDNLRSIYSDTYYTIEKIVAKFSNLAPLFWSFPDIFKELYVYKENPPENKIYRLFNELMLLKENLDVRFQNWNYYHKHLIINDNIQLPKIRNGSVPWRYTFRVKNNKQTLILNELRNNNMHASAWYPSLYPRFRICNEINTDKCPVSGVLSNELVNLWVDPKNISALEVEKVCGIVNGCL